MTLDDDDQAVIERALTWLYSENSPDASGDDRSPVATAVAAVLREVEGLSASSIALLLAEHWNLFACDPPLLQREIEQAVRQAFEVPRHEPATLHEAPSHNAAEPVTRGQPSATEGREEHQPVSRPLTPAERSRRYRQRKKARGPQSASTALWMWEVPA